MNMALTVFILGVKAKSMFYIFLKHIGYLYHFKQMESEFLRIPQFPFLWVQKAVRQAWSLR